MTDILLCSLITSLFCLGFKISTGEGMALSFIANYLDSILYKNKKEVDEYDGMINPKEPPAPQVAKIYYPLLYCIKCMPSIYGTGIALLLFPFTFQLFFQIPLVIFCSVTLNCIFYQMYE